MWNMIFHGFFDRGLLYRGYTCSANALLFQVSRQELFKGFQKRISTHIHIHHVAWIIAGRPASWHDGAEDAHLLKHSFVFPKFTFRFGQKSTSTQGGTKKIPENETGEMHRRFPWCKHASVSRGGWRDGGMEAWEVLLYSRCPTPLTAKWNIPDIGTLTLVPPPFIKPPRSPPYHN